MNCKQGDIAIIVKSHSGNEGKIVRCLRLIGNKDWRRPDGQIASMLTWETDVSLSTRSGRRINAVPDEVLRPICDPGEDATDETFTWLSLPQKEPT